MSILKFTDGEVFDTSGQLRKEERYDGWYVIGEGKLIPVKDEKEADMVIDELKFGKRSF
jgi:hypothetical protein